MIKNSSFINYAVFLLCLTFTGCQNFIEGSSFKSQLKEDIDYANSSPCEIRIECLEGSGTITSESKVSKKVTDSFNIEFKISTDYHFVCWKAYSKSSDNTLTELSDEYISFSNYNTSSADGIYKVSVKYKKEVSNIVIKPLCFLLPKVTGSFPIFDNAGYPQDSSLKIYFNKAVNISDFCDADGFLKNITIKAGETNLLDTIDGAVPYYKNPYLENNDKTLVIPIVNGNYIIKNGSGESKDISVTLDLADLTDNVDGEKLSFEEESYSFTFRINATKDSVAPVFKTLNIARTEEDARNGTNLISMEEFTRYAAEACNNNDSSLVADNIHNHHVNKIWVYFETEDLESGVENVLIEEKLIYNKAAVEENGDLYSKNYQNSSETKSFSDCFEYNFSTPGDGVINLTFCLYDYSGNVTKKEIDLIKDTLCLYKAYIYMPYLNKYYFIDDDGYATATFRVTPISQSNVHDNFIIDLDGNAFIDEIYYENENENPIKISKIEYGSSKDNLTSLSFENLPYKEVKYQYGRGYYKEYSPEIRYKASSDLIVIVTTEDSIGNTSSYESTFPAAASFINCYEDTVKVGAEDKTAWYFLPDTKKQYRLYYIYEDSEGNKSDIKTPGTYFTGTSYIYKLNDIYLDEIADGTYYFYALPATYTSSFLNIFTFGNPWIIYKNISKPESSATLLTEDSIPAFTIVPDEPVLNSGIRHISVKLEEGEVLNPNLKYIIEYKNTSNNSTLYSRDFEFDINTDYSFYDFRLMVQNEIGENIFSEAVSIDLTFDNVRPNAGYPQNHLLIGNTWFLIFNYCSDNNGAGLKTNENGDVIVKYITSPAALNIDDIEWENNSRVETSYIDSFYGIKVPYDGGNAKYVYIYLEDINGNYCTWETHEEDYLAVIPALSKNSNGTFTVNNKPVDSNNTTAWYLTTFYLEDGNWTITEEITKSSIYNSSLYDTNHTFVLNLSDNEKDSFIKVNCYNKGITQGINAPTYLSYSDYALYFYPQYYLKDDFTCELKSYLECADNEIAVLADNPCLVQTFYSSTNLGDNLIEWISFANEVKIQQKNCSFTYTVPLNEIPEGKFYTTVIHYADGTKKMTAIKQK
ncbi:MAG: hypothetical protein K6D95_07240 [Treponema sp.]|nr:hypothetical protein [Treponema sp.]